MSGKFACIRLNERPGLGGGGYFTKFFSREVRHVIKNGPNQSVLKFCKNEGSIRSKTNEKGGQLDRKLIQNGIN